ncbi:UMP kinase [bacterium]|nr:UMP kinase [bacterium]MCP5462803.1 UMP kinase [bacterium]
MSRPVRYKRVMLKLSGEALKGNHDYGIDFSVVRNLVFEIKKAVELGVELALVIGGGNIFRGINTANNIGIDRITGDNMGMLATVINGLALQKSLESSGIKSKVVSAIEMNKVTEFFDVEKVEKYFSEKSVVIFVAGTGNPFFSTDTAAALRASEIKADVIMKATKVDGVYSADPIKFPNAVFYPELNYERALNEKLNVMDLTAISLCMENKIPILVFNMNKEDNIKKAVSGETVGTVIRG